MNRSFVFLAEGFEEIEAITVVDVMRRAGLDVKTVSITNDRQVIGAHGVTLLADTLFKDTEFSAADAEWLILPGGMPGATNLHKFDPLNALLKAHAKHGKIAAICASPAVVLAPIGLLEGKEATCYPGFEDVCRENGAHMRDVPVMATDKLITANGPSSTIRFALAIVSNSLGDNHAHDVGSQMLYYPKSMNFYF
jgi:4-methyl-5(b-hydroxyethyl)-thiazole monophosphate biosynthesis